MDALLARDSAESVLFWDHALGTPAVDVVEKLRRARGDVYHGGLALGLQGQPDDIDYIHSLWWHNIDPAPDREATSWRVSFRACLVETAVLRQLGHIDPSFKTLQMAGLDAGLRWLRGGAVVCHTPDLGVSGAAAPLPVPEDDRYLFLLKHFPRKWVAYALARRCLGNNPLRERRAYRRAVSRKRIARQAITPLGRPPVAMPPSVSVSVILPTLGRYELLKPLLDQLAAQTVRPKEVICVDQNNPELRDPTVYEGYDEMNLSVVFQDGKGQWLARNEAVARSSGEYLMFVDDDSTIEPDFIAAHLEGLQRYNADVSTGASLAVVGAPVPEDYAHFHVATQFDSGNGLCTREIMRQVGAFDRHYDRMRKGDADFGLRVYLSGGLVIHNPNAKRIHFKAAAGGLREFGSWDVYRERGFLTPLPSPSVLYYGRRHHSSRQVREELLLGLVLSAVPYRLKRRLSPIQWVVVAMKVVLQAPVLALRVQRSRRRAAVMVEQGPLIPAVE